MELVDEGSAMAGSKSPLEADLGNLESRRSSVTYGTQ